TTPRRHPINCSRRQGTRGQALEQATYEISSPTRPLSSLLGTSTPRVPHEKGRSPERPYYIGAAPIDPLRKQMPPKTLSSPLPPKSCDLPTTPSIGRQGEGCRCRLRRSST